MKIDILKKKKVIFAVIGVILALILLSSFIVLRQPRVRRYVRRGIAFLTSPLKASKRLILAVNDGNYEKAEKILKQSPTAVKGKDYIGMTPLHYAAMKGDEKMIDLLCRKGAKIDGIQENGATPLHYAALSGKASAVYKLVDFGAEVNTWDENLSTPLHKAAYAGKTKTVEALLKRGADKTLKDNNGNTALDLALSRGNGEAVKLLKDEKRNKPEPSTTN